MPAGVGDRVVTGLLERELTRPITDEGVAVGGAFDSDTATG